MLKKNYLVLFLVISALLVTGCSSKKKKNRTTPTGSVVFFQNIEGTGTLQLKALNTSERNSYGSVAFEQFTAAVSLNVGEWQVAVTQNKTGDSQNTEELARGRFRIEQDRISLVAATNIKGEATVLPLAFAKREGERSINVSHLFDGLGTVDIYLRVDEDGLDCADESSFDEPAQVSSLALGKTSEAVKLAISEEEKAICVQIKEGGDVVYQSGQVILEDSPTQTLLLTKNTSPLAQADAINLIYYSQGRVTLWSNIADQVAEVRVLNLFEVESIEGAELTLFPVDDDETSYGFDSSIASLSLSLLADDTVPANLSYFLEAKNSNNASLSAPLIMPFSGQQITVVYFNEHEPKSMKVNSLKGIVKDRSQVQISAPLVASNTDASRYNIFLLKQSETDFNEVAATLSPRSTTVLDVEPGDYQLVVTDAGEDSIVSLASSTLQLAADENYQLMLYKEGGGFSLCWVDVDNNQCVAQ